MEKFQLVNIVELLRTHYGSDIEVQKQHADILTGPGEHYGSIILKVDLELKINGVLQILNLVAKKIPVNELLQKAFDVQVTFKKEAFAYTITIPTLLDFQKEFGFPEDKLINFFPKCYGYRYNLEGTNEHIDQNGALLLENLKTVGYETVDRLVGFDLESSMVILKNLARFHAVPLALKLLRPEVFKEKVLPGLVKHKGAEQLGEEVGKVFHGTIMSTALKCEELKPYLSRLQKVVDYYETHLLIDRPPPSEEYGTVTHCDVWTSNIMVLKNSNGVATKLKLLDLQLTNYSSPIRDLIFFMFTSVQNDILLENLDCLIEYYHENFVDTLKYFDIDLEPYSWKNFNEELENVAPDEVYHILVMLKIIYSQRGKVTNTLDNFQISDWIRPDLLGEDHKRKLKNTVLTLASKNWI
ncbi:hypothetical protein WA026_005468 [Henosepilachna vigintioctopunctata]|uniref:CHK kinase-like domain-containing protein n=1 Tax=Henosepilachna vigintioctopunctata TaxID=420089 RepID=A0AAW1U204_9CUCU